MTENIQRVLQATLCLLKESITERVRYSIDLDVVNVEKILRQAYLSRIGTSSVIGASGQMFSKVAAWITGNTDKNSILLQGGVGCGKTTMANAICDAFTAIRDSSRKERDVALAQLPYSSVRPKTEFDHLASLPTPVRVHAQKLADKSVEKIATVYKACNLLFLDDLGCEPVAVKSYGTEITPATDIICSRYEAMLPMIITTNLTLDMIKQRYGERISDRLKEMCDRVVFSNPSYRN